MKKGKPGAMFYFERMPSLEMLTPAELGRVFAAAMHYAQTGEEPQLKGRADFAWKFIKPDIDHDDQRYAERCEENRWRVYCREAKRHGEEPMPYEDWKEWRECVIGPSGEE